MGLVGATINPYQFMKQLPRGIRLDHGYVQVRIFHDRHIYCKNFGPDSPLAREYALRHLLEKRHEIRLGKFGITPAIPRKKFPEVAQLWYNLWAKELTPDGMPVHRTPMNTWNMVVKSIIPHFPGWYDEIRPRDIQTWREKRLKTVLGTSVNREQAILSSIFSHIQKWIETERIRPFQLPVDPSTKQHWNPCRSVEKAKLRKRERVLTMKELKLLKAACVQHNDPDLWDICRMALNSLLRKKDLQNLEAGLEIHMIQAKTQRNIRLPMGVEKPLNYVNFKRRWMAVQKATGLEDFQFRDLRKTGANVAKELGYSTKIISELLGHSNTRTTELYMVPNAEHLVKPLQDLSDFIDKI